MKPRANPALNTNPLLNCSCKQLFIFICKEQFKSSFYDFKAFEITFTSYRDVVTYLTVELSGKILSTQMQSSIQPINPAFINDLLNALCQLSILNAVL